MDSISPHLLGGFEGVPEYKRVRERALLKGRKGAFSRSAINRRFHKHLEQAGIRAKNLSYHSLRHSVATPTVLYNRTDLRYVQKLLGHESVETTIGYTRELSENIRRIYKTQHPRRMNTTWRRVLNTENNFRGL